ncbi:MAG: three-Cys-motif partner protein TcmP [Brevundimonas sp.]|uniref:three-Cys-motif partner protein TcmP n=1 Tax=Brevundimonas sp. TaxID=1871086 RepID=UPI002AB8A89D|nr:three-Cys-motif partner protein TcmP [Brevundimonas sp.]MDZ4109674.1 three-Cys-motif partner protein TcmP [Brevundimonas sp.]
MTRDKASYQGREQAFVKHYLLETYLERLFQITANRFDQIVYVDGYSGPWQSQGQSLEDTSFCIALSALRKAKSFQAARGRTVEVHAHLVEKSPQAFRVLETIAAKFPDVRISTYKADFRTQPKAIAAQIPDSAFTFVFIDPKGWRINTAELAPLLRRKNCEVLFNFMFDFVNRAASMTEPPTVEGINELIPDGDWREQLTALSAAGATPAERKQILIGAFSRGLAEIGDFKFVAETPVLRPLHDRTLYSLIFATKKARGLEVFRECQLLALTEQSKIRGEAKLRAISSKANQFEMFGSLTDMAPDETLLDLPAEIRRAEATLLSLIPLAPETVAYGDVWPQVLSAHVVRKMHVGQIAAQMRNNGQLKFEGWAPRKRTPDDDYRVSRT